MSSGYNLDLKEGVHFRVKRGHWLPRKAGVECIALGRTLYHAREGGQVPRHEYLHLAQFARYGTPRVLLHYLVNLARNYYRHRDFGKAFRDVPFEVEARQYEAGAFDA